MKTQTPEGRTVKITRVDGGFYELECKDLPDYDLTIRRCSCERSSCKLWDATGYETGYWGGYRIELHGYHYLSEIKEDFLKAIDDQVKENEEALIRAKEEEEEMEEWMDSLINPEKEGSQISQEPEIKLEMTHVSSDSMIFELQPDDGSVYQLHLMPDRYGGVLIASTFASKGLYRWFPNDGEVKILSSDDSASYFQQNVHAWLQSAKHQGQSIAVMAECRWC